MPCSGRADSRWQDERERSSGWAPSTASGGWPPEMEAAGPHDSVAAFLRTVSLFAGLSDDLLDTLVASTEEICLPGGAWLFKEGDATDNLYVVRSGRLAAVHEGASPPEVLRVFTPGDVVGELAFLTES